MNMGILDENFTLTTKIDPKDVKILYVIWIYNHNHQRYGHYSCEFSIGIT